MPFQPLTTDEQKAYEATGSVPSASGGSFQPLEPAGPGSAQGTASVPGLPAPEPPKGAFSLRAAIANGLDRLGEGMNGVQSGLQTAMRFTGLPQLTGFATRMLGEVIGGGVGAITGAAVAPMMKKPVGQTALDWAGAGSRSVGDFGQAIGEPAPLATAEYLFGGKIFNLLNTLPQFMKGYKQIVGQEAPDVLGQPVPGFDPGLAAGINIGLGAMSAYGAAKSPGWLPFGVEKIPGKVLSTIKMMRAAAVPAGVQTEITKPAGDGSLMEGPGAASKKSYEMADMRKKLDTYVEQAQTAERDYSQPTPLDMAGDKAEEALTALQKGKTAFGEAKSEVVNLNGRKMVPGLNDVRTGFVSELQNRLNLTVQDVVDDAGVAHSTVIPTGAGEAKVSDAEIGQIQKLWDQMNGLGDKATVKRVDATVDRLQAEVYGPEKNVMVQPSDKVDAMLKYGTRELNGKLGDVLGDDFKTYNAYYGAVADEFDWLNKSLGQEGSKGGSLMKRIFSPTDGGTKMRFDRIKALTGIDLVQEGTLAKFAMEAVGDNRARSLLEQLDLKDMASPMKFTSKAIKFIFDKIAKDYFDPEKVAQDIASGKLKVPNSGTGKGTPPFPGPGAESAPSFHDHGMENAPPEPGLMTDASARADAKNFDTAQAHQGAAPPLEASDATKLAVEMATEAGQKPLENALRQSLDANKGEAGGATFDVFKKANLAGSPNTAGSLYPERSVVHDVPVGNIDGMVESALKNITKYAADNADLISQPGHEVGVWLDTKSGKLYLDVSAAFPQDKVKPEVVNEFAGKAGNQIATFDLNKMQQLDSGGTGTTEGVVGTLEQRVAWTKRLMAGDLSVLDEVKKLIPKKKGK